jgi:hypothetical protein
LRLAERARCINRVKQLFLVIAHRVRLGRSCEELFHAKAQRFSRGLFFILSVKMNTPTFVILNLFQDNELPAM